MNKTALNGLRDMLLEGGHAAYVSFAPPLNQYLTGFRGTTSGVIVTDSEALFLCDFRYAEQAEVQVDSAFTIERIGSEGMTKAVARRLNALKLSNAAFEPQYMTYAEFQALDREFGGKLKPVSQLVSALRTRKTSEEVERIRTALRLSERVLEEILEELEPGITEREVAARFEYAFKQRGASGASFPTIALFGSRSSLPHGEPGDRALQMGDVVLFDFGCRLDGYCSDLTRTYVFGTIPGAWLEDIYALTHTAQQRAIEAVRAGISCQDLDAVARSLIAEAGHGDHFGHGLGHGVGIEIHEAPRVGIHSDTTLEPGMVITIEPGVYLPGQGGVRIEDVVVVEDEGCTVLSSAPKEFRILHR